VLEFHDSVPLLILDDLCFEMDSYATDHVRTWTGKLLDGRRARGLATLVGTNLSSAAVTEILGARIYSRLAGTALPLEFKHRDRREPISWG
jgi:DNA replication protein DnaC